MRNVVSGYRLLKGVKITKWRLDRLAKMLVLLTTFIIISQRGYTHGIINLYFANLFDNASKRRVKTKRLEVFYRLAVIYTSAT